MGRKGYSKSVKADARASLAAGESAASIARRLGVGEATVRSWGKAPAGGMPVPPKVEQAPPPPPRPEAPPQPQAGPSPHERAKAALGGEPPKPGAQAGAAPIQQTPEQAAAALIMISEVATRVAVKFYAARCKVKMTPELARSLNLSEEERANLQTYAPYAAPFVWDLLKEHGAKIGAALYGFVLYDVILSRTVVIKELGKREADARRAQEEAQAAAESMPGTTGSEGGGVPMGAVQE